MRLRLFEELLDGQKIVLTDIGAAGGIDRFWKKLADVLQIITFEPDQRSSLGDSPDCSKQSKTINFNFALGEKDQEVDFYLTAFPPASSVFQPDIDFISAFPNIGDHQILKKEHRFLIRLVWGFYQRIRPHWHEFVISDQE